MLVASVVLSPSFGWFLDIAILLKKIICLEDLFVNAVVILDYELC